MALEPLSTVGLSDDPALAASIRRRAHAGDTVRLHRGLYVDGAEWASAAEHDRHRLLVTSIVPRLVDGPVVSHRSAVALHRLPWIGAFGDRAVVTDPRRDRGQAKRSVERIGSAGRRPRAVVIDGLVVTDLVGTAVDIALREHPWRAIVVLDAVLRRGVDSAALVDELDRRRSRRLCAARGLIENATGAAESPGESITRWGAHVLGTPTPVAQQAFRHDGVFVDRVDLWFPEQGVVVEFDGRAKYVDPALRNGRTAEDVLFDEKRREDRLRRRSDVHGLVRVTWADAMPGGQVPRLLGEAGIPLGRSWATAWRAAALRTL
ncbi:hypothetical protein [Curtobacterium sp. L1-20]|uniref:hypothetical protein n=1 Tax=Curtobacterium sp. L1-20 TaxID=3138181 RepID=UPI003B52C160